MAKADTTKNAQLKTDLTAFLAATVDSKGDVQPLTAAQLEAIGAMPVKRVKVIDQTTPKKAKAVKK